MSSLRKVSVAIPSWNGREHLEVALEALAQQVDPGVAWEILVLDNGSRDGTAEWLRRHHPQVRLLESPVNLGFCVGCNRLVEAAAGEAVAFLNNDTRAERGWLAAAVDALSAAPPDVAAVSGQIVDWVGERLDFARGVMTFDGHAFQLDFRRPLARARIPVDGAELPFACGGNLLIRRSSFVAAGGFDPNYFAYLEDVDLGWRLWAGGERVLFARQAVVRHRSSATSDLLGLFNRGFLFERNAFLTAYKNYEAGLWERVMPAVLWTLLARTQTLLVTHNPGGASLALDPYAGAIGDTAPRPFDSASAPTSVGPGVGTRAGSHAERGPASGDERVLGDLGEKWRGYGAREFFRRGLAKAWRLARGARSISPAAGSDASAPTLNDPRTVAQLRALSFLLGHLDEAAASRSAVQARRRRPDRDYFERFPAYLVPTYPGDEELFASSGFGAWLPEELPLVRATLAEIMEWGS